jgi:hypothetical protein
VQSKPRKLSFIAFDVGQSHLFVLGDLVGAASCLALAISLAIDIRVCTRRLLRRFNRWT